MQWLVCIANRYLAYWSMINIKEHFPWSILMNSRSPPYARAFSPKTTSNNLLRMPLRTTSSPHFKLPTPSMIQPSNRSKTTIRPSSTAPIFSTASTVVRLSLACKENLRCRKNKIHKSVSYEWGWSEDWRTRLRIYLKTLERESLVSSKRMIKRWEPCWQKTVSITPTFCKEWGFKKG